jgi:hypothetical protein
MTARPGHHPVESISIFNRMLHIDAACAVAARPIGATPLQAGPFALLALASAQRARHRFSMLRQNSN